MTHFELFQGAVLAHSLQTAITDDQATVTYGELADQVADKYRRLCELGVQSRHRVLLGEAPTIEVVAWLLACWHRQVVVCVVPTVPQPGGTTALSDAIRPHARIASTGSVVLADPVPGEMIGGFLGPPDMLIATSGTSGQPKIVAHSFTTLLHGLLATVALQDAAVLPASVDQHTLADIRLGLTLLSVAPLSTMAGLTVLQRSLLTGEHLVLTEHLGPRSLLEAIERYQVTNISLPPLIAQQLLGEYTRRPADVSSLLFVGIGGGPVPPSTVRRVEEAFSCLTAVGYGCTEMGGPVLMGRPTDPLEVRAETVGRPLPGMTCDVDIDEGTSDRPSLQGGELLVSGPSRMLGYWSGGTDSAMDGPWYRTGDLVSKRDDGSFVMIGRRSALIIRGGQNIDPLEIENVISEHPAVLHVGVIGRPSKVPGEQDIIAYVVPVGSRPVPAGELLRWCLDRLPNVKVPRRFVPATKLPTARDGGIDRIALAELPQIP